MKKLRGRDWVGNMKKKEDKVKIWIRSERVGSRKNKEREKEEIKKYEVNEKEWEAGRR